MVIDQSGIDAGGQVITDVAAGEVNSASTDAVNGSQLHTTNQQVSDNTSNITANSTAIAQGINISDGTTADNYQLGDTVHITGTGSITTQVTDTGLQVGLKDDIAVSSISAGNTSMSQDGFNAGGNTITNVASGVNDTDAVNVAQLDGVRADAFGYTDSRIHEMDDRTNAAIAGALAFNAINAPNVPGKVSMGVGAGTWEGQQGYAVGIGYTSPDSQYFINGAFGGSNGQKGGNIGVSYVFD